MIAAQTGLSLATVSLGLRRSPLLTVETCTRVQNAAAEIGYRPDPDVAKLMTRLRLGRTPSFKSTLYALTTCTPNSFTQYAQDVRNSARQRADELGYGFVVEQVNPRTYNRRTFQRALVNQGIEGILLLPMATPLPVDDLLDWSRFSVLSATYGVLSPEFHRVVPHQFSNIRMACKELAALGYRRIGLIHGLHQSTTVNHGFLAAVATQNLVGPTAPVLPLLYSTPLPTGVASWLKREKPDAVIIDGEHIHDAVLRELGVKTLHPLGVVLTSRERDSLLSGIDEHGKAVGRVAVEQLALKIQHGDKGIPAEPIVTMVEGHWIATRSVRRQSAAGRARAVASR